jgi:hypothetical protein
VIRQKAAPPVAVGRVTTHSDTAELSKAIGEVSRGESDLTVTSIEPGYGNIRLETYVPGCRGAGQITTLEGLNIDSAAGRAGLEEALGVIAPDEVLFSEATLRSVCAADWGGENAAASRITESLRPLAERLGADIRVFDPGAVDEPVGAAPTKLDPYVAVGLTRGKVTRLDVHGDDVHSLILAFTGGARTWRAGEVVTGGLIQLEPIGRTVAQIRGTIYNRADKLDRQYTAAGTHLTAEQWLGDLMTEVRGCALVLIDAGVLEAAAGETQMRLIPTAVAKTYDVAVAVVTS